MNKKKKYEVLRFEDKYKEEVLRLVSKEWDKFDEAYFIWKFFKNPYSNIVGYVILFNKKVVGFRGLMGTNFMLNKNQLSFLSLADGVIHKSHRRKGLFTKINNYLLKDLPNHSDVRLVYTMSSTGPSSESYLKRNWKVLSMRRILIYKNISGLVMTKRIKNKFIRKIVEYLLSFQYLIFKKEISLDYNTKVLISENPYPNLLSEVNSKSISNKIEQKKDKRYYEWRLSDPNRSNKFIYSYLFKNKNEVIAYSIFSLKGNYCYLIDYNYKKDIKNLSFLLNYTIRRKNLGFLITWATGVDNNTLNEFRNIGFFEPNILARLFSNFLENSFQHNLPIIINTTDSVNHKNGWKIDDIDIKNVENWSIKMIDSDGV